MPKNIPSWLRQAIADLAAIAEDGNLRDLQLAFGTECRASGGLPSLAERQKQVNHLNAAAVVKAREIAHVAAVLFGMPKNECERIARDLLVQDPWTIRALALIEHYLRPSRVPTPKDKAQWNGVTGGPAVERWEQQQKKQLASHNGARRRAW